MTVTKQHIHETKIYVCTWKTSLNIRQIFFKVSFWLRIRKLFCWIKNKISGRNQNLKRITFKWVHTHVEIFRSASCILFHINEKPTHILFLMSERNRINTFYYAYRIHHIWIPTPFIKSGKNNFTPALFSPQNCVW